MTRALLFGLGRMGQLVEQHAPAHGVDVVGALTRGATAETWQAWRQSPVDVVIDFATGEALVSHLDDLCRVAKTLVIGSTGWSAHAADVQETLARHGVGAVVASNFSVGAHVLEAAAVAAARLLADADEYEAFLPEAHHARKRDAPSGTAKSLLAALTAAGYTRHVDVAVTRAGHVPGTHSLAFDGPAETIALTHTVRDRATFAHGALRAARWIQGRTGVYSMKDVLGISYA
jgi:4-hydroxy-tetrahydrodipicolinate reductase